MLRQSKSFCAASSSSCMPEDDRFDQITRTAEQLFNVPVALVSLVGGNRYSHCQIDFEFDSEEILKNSLFWQ